MKTPLTGTGRPEHGPDRPVRRWLGLVGWLLLTFGASATAAFVSTDGWYAELAKPTWNPPGWIFGPVWTTLYLMMAVAAWRVWLRGGWAQQKMALGLFLLQWALNALWTPLFFGLHQPGWALLEILLLLAVLLATIRAFWSADRIASALLFPYAAWVAFASVLNGAIWWLN
jgi:translocator protein